MGARADSPLALTIIPISVQILMKAYKSNIRSIFISILVKKKTHKKDREKLFTNLARKKNKRERERKALYYHKSGNVMLVYF